MVIYSCAKYGMTMSKDKKAVTRTWRHFKNPINLTLRLKVNIVSVSWMYATQRLMVIDLFTKYDLPVSKQSRGNRSGTKRCQKNTNLTLRSKVNIDLESRMYAIHHLMVMHLHVCTKYGMPMSKQTRGIWTTSLTWDTFPI